jgi:SAM-dependent methyltransferase
MPFREASFDLVVAFEVIEHLQDWRALLCESRRVLAESGLMIVSTPNRAYYTESRGSEGANPFHVHEFDFAEFRDVLHEFFPHVEILQQNRVESLVFHGAGGLADARVGDGERPEEAHFFIGVCSTTVLPELRNFVYVSRAANLLREREQHIRKLEIELGQVSGWLDQQIRDHAELQRQHESLTQHLEEKNRWALELDANLRAANRWALELDANLRAAQERIVRVQEELKIAEAENRASAEWALQLDRRLAEKAEQLAATVRLLDTAEGTVVERTEWAQRLDKELAEVRTQLAMARESRWVKLGRSVGVGPKL